VYCLGVAFALTLVCAAAPALAVNRSATAPGLTHAATQTSRRTRGRRLLVVAQVAICVVLLSGASILFHDVVRMRRTDPGFDTTHTMFVEVRPAPDAAGFRLRPFERVRAVTRSLPGVESVSTARNLPLMFLTQRASVHLDGASGPPRRIDIAAVGPRYFETLRIPLLRGRDLVDQDMRFQGREATAVVVNQTLAERFFG